MRTLETDHVHLAAALTPRDRWILRMLAEHRVLTTPMFVGLAFPSDRAAQLRLRALFELGVINRFQPLLPLGSAPMHWILDTPGHHVLAAEDHPAYDPFAGQGAGGGRRDRTRRAHALALAHSHQLTHLLQVNMALTALAADQPGNHADQDSVNGNAGLDRVHPGGAAMGGLVLWWSQAHATRCVGDFVHPDAYAHYRHHHAGGGLAFFYEHDRGSEPRAQLARKIVSYHQLAEATAITTPVLFWLPTPARETMVRAALAAALDALAVPGRVPIATTSPTTPAPQLGGLRAASAIPRLAGQVWLPVTREPLRLSDPTPARLSLAELASLWPHHPGRDHTTRPQPPPLAPRRDRRTDGLRNGGAELAAPHPIPPPATPHPAQRSRPS